MSKVIERRMTLRDQVTPTMSKINKNTLTYKKHTRDLRRDGQRTWFGIRRGMLGVAAAGAALIGSVMAINKMEEAYKAQSQAEVKLQAVFKATGKATSEQVEGLKDYANTMQKVGVVGDEVTLAGMQQLSTFNVTSNTVETLTEGMLDLVAQQKGLNATQQDMVNIGNMVGKVMDGQTGALSRVGISFTDAQEQVLKYGTEQEKAATLAQVLQQNVGGVNAALAATDEGQIVQVKNAIGDVQEVMGGVVVKIKGEFARAFNDHLPAIETKINAVSSAINNWVEGGGITRFIDTLQTVHQTTKDLSPVIGILAAGLVAYKLYALAATVQTWSLNAAMAANPVGFVITAILGLITVITLLRKNKDLLQLKFMETWNAAASYTESGMNKMIGGANTVISAFDFMGKSIKYSFHSMWNDVVGMSENAVSKLAKPLNAVLRAVGKEEINVNFSSGMSSMEKPMWEKTDYIGEIQVKRYSDDTIAQIEESRRRKQQQQSKDNTEALEMLANAMDENTGAVSENTSALGKSSSDLTGEQIADKLLPRLERTVYG
ncbi:hypothetical protein SAMN05660297_02743 [Natronincola peptidivorans]|uniref:Uncharacterized protein n=1 Tax=Natronincola peptidivorans TaxID=426128 RepID=A0A1I0FBY5_9FIRM|nr:hypothetical protein [Natronincola peptidivorans]SET55444.1 hypothetical protein SAMN05660297_02743 [Natronincola peptidivorans]